VPSVPCPNCSRSAFNTQSENVFYLTGFNGIAHKSDEPRPYDLADYFGSIPHAELVKSVTRRIVDRRVLHLIKMWLECPVEETDDRGRKTRTTEARDNRRGIPQGSPISPLLANPYMRRFVLGWKKLGLERSLGSRIVTYADDLVILCRRGKAGCGKSSCPVR
jgi:retron-type reverse transcriptase